ncbi:MAG TPA: hypothetical protein VHX39_02560, partial [Acetobacteraceae bacterium]|nr:hypothetical protein [Acetobacteraceae bacterium]
TRAFRSEPPIPTRHTKVPILFLARLAHQHNFPGIATQTGRSAMDLSAYLLDQAIAATTPPGETEADARTRAEAIAEMLRAYAPGDMLETMMACQCIMMQFVAAAAMRDASNPRQEPATLAKARAGAITASRALHQWVTKFENQRKRNELRAAQLAKAELAKAGAAKVAAAKVETGAKPGPQTPPDVPEPQSSVVTTAPAAVRNGQITDDDVVTNQLLAAAAEMRAASHVSGSARPGS